MADDNDVKELTAKLDQLITKMGEPKQQAQDELPTVLGLGPVRPWINLIHTVGLPWVGLGGMVYISVVYGVPFVQQSLTQQQQINGQMKDLNDQATKAMPMLEEATQAIPLLRQIHKTAQEGTAQRHRDLEQVNAAVQESVERAADKPEDK